MLEHQFLGVHPTAGKYSFDCRTRNVHLWGAPRVRVPKNLQLIARRSIYARIDSPLCTDISLEIQLLLLIWIWNVMFVLKNLPESVVNVWLSNKTEDGSNILILPSRSRGWPSLSHRIWGVGMPSALHSRRTVRAEGNHCDIGVFTKYGACTTTTWKN